MPEQKPCDYYNGRVGNLRIERATFIPHYQELSEFVQPRRGRFTLGDHNKGDSRYNKIINSKATRALRVARAGLIAGVMSPATPSFAYGTLDPDLNDFHAVKVWLAKLAEINRTILNEGNFYNMAPSCIGEYLLFGTGCITHLDDFDDVARFYTHTVGSYMIGQDEKFKVDTLVREYEMQTIQMVRQFGKENCSQAVQDAYDKGNYETWYPVTHFIGRNRDYRPGKKLSRYKAFESVYYQPDELSKERYLSRKGFDKFPGYAPRWDVTGEDVYATDCPGMTALGDIKGLQIEERRKAQAIDKQVNPPLKGPAMLKTVNSVAGGLTVYDADASKEGLSPVYQVNPQLQEMRLDMKAVEDRIDDAFFVKLFLAISDMEGVQPRNQLELKQRDQERLLQLGDPLQRLYGEFLDPMHDRLLEQGFAAGIYPPPPKEIQGQHLKPRYIGPLSIAQRSTATGAIERTATFVGGLIGGGFPQAGAKVDADKMVEKYASVVGIDPDIIVPDDVVQATRQAEANAKDNQTKIAAAEATAGAADKGASAVNKLANAPMQGGASNALENLIQTVKDRSSSNVFAPPQR